MDNNSRQQRRLDSAGNPGQQVEQTKYEFISSRVTDHLANERTFLAWVRTALAIMAFGFAVERVGLALRGMGIKSSLSIYLWVVSVSKLALST